MSLVNFTIKSSWITNLNINHRQVLLTLYSVDFSLDISNGFTRRYFYGKCCPHEGFDVNFDVWILQPNIFAIEIVRKTIFGHFRGLFNTLTVDKYQSSLLFDSQTGNNKIISFDDRILRTYHSLMYMLITLCKF